MGVESPGKPEVIFESSTEPEKIPRQHSESRRCERQRMIMVQCVALGLLAARAECYALPLSYLPLTMGVAGCWMVILARTPTTSLDLVEARNEASELPPGGSTAPLLMIYKPLSKALKPVHDPVSTHLPGHTLTVILFSSAPQLIRVPTIHQEFSYPCAFAAFSGLPFSPSPPVQFIW